MRLQLTEANIELDASTLPSDLTQIYETYILKRILHSLIEGINNTKYTLHGAHIITDI